MSFPKYDKSVLCLSDLTSKLVEERGYQPPALHYDHKQVGGFAGPQPAGEVVDGRWLPPDQEPPRNELIRAIIAPSLVREPAGERPGQLFFTVLGSTLRACCELDDMDGPHIAALGDLGFRRLAVDFVYNGPVTSGSGSREVPTDNQQVGTGAEVVARAERIHQVGIQAVHGVERVFDGRAEVRPSHRPSIVLEGMVLGAMLWNLETRQAGETFETIMLQIAYDRHDPTRTVWVPLTRAVDWMDGTETVPGLDDVMQMRVTPEMWRQTLIDKESGVKGVYNYMLPEQAGRGAMEVAVLQLAEGAWQQTAALVGTIVSAHSPEDVAIALSNYIEERDARYPLFFGIKDTRYVERMAISNAEKLAILAALRAKRWSDEALPAGMRLLEDDNRLTANRIAFADQLLYQADLLSDEEVLLKHTTGGLIRVACRLLDRRLREPLFAMPAEQVARDAQINTPDHPIREVTKIVFGLLSPRARQRVVGATIDSIAARPDEELFGLHTRQLIVDIYHHADQEQRIQIIQTVAAAITERGNVYALVQNAYNEYGWSDCVLDILVQDLQFAAFAVKPDEDPELYKHWQAAAMAFLDGLARTKVELDELPVTRLQRERLKGIQRNLQAC